MASKDKTAKEKFISTYKVEASLPTRDLSVKNLKKNSEDRLKKTTKLVKGLDKNTIVLFDFDGTQVDYDKHMQAHIRKLFVDCYEESKNKSLTVGTCTMRKSNLIEQLKGYEMDIVIGADSMMDYLEEKVITEEQIKYYQQYKHTDEETTQKEFKKVVKEFREKRKVTDKLIGMLYFLREYSLRMGDPNLLKILFLIRWIKEYPDLKVFLFDDSGAVGGVGEELGIAMQV